MVVWPGNVMDVRHVALALHGASQSGGIACVTHVCADNADNCGPVPSRCAGGFEALPHRSGQHTRDTESLYMQR